MQSQSNHRLNQQPRRDENRIEQYLLVVLAAIVGWMYGMTAVNPTGSDNVGQLADGW